MITILLQNDKDFVFSKQKKIISNYFSFYYDWILPLFGIINIQENKPYIFIIKSKKKKKKIKHINFPMNKKQIVALSIALVAMLGSLAYLGSTPNMMNFLKKHKRNTHDGYGQYIGYSSTSPCKNVVRNRNQNRKQLF